MAPEPMRVCTINGCRVGEEHLEPLRRIFDDYAHQVASHEPGCLLLRVLQDAGDPTSFLVYAEFADQQAYEAHLASDHVARLRERLHPLIGDTHHKLVLRPVA
jgi:quinol monooxygenase YgiN